MDRQGLWPPTASEALAKRPSGQLPQLQDHAWACHLHLSIPAQSMTTCMPCLVNEMQPSQVLNVLLAAAIRSLQLMLHIDHCMMQTDKIIDTICQPAYIVSTCTAYKEATFD